jgi:hypothetical protein
MQEEIKFRKIELAGDELIVHYVEPMPGHKKKINKLKCDVPVHEDLKDAVQKLHKHFAILSDQLECKVKSIDKWEDQKLEKFFVIGFDIAGADEKETISLIGYKLGKFGTVDIDSPPILFSSNYAHISDLSADVQACLHEAEQYLFYGKRADDVEEEDTAQQKIPFKEKHVEEDL